MINGTDSFGFVKMIPFLLKGLGMLIFLTCEGVSGQSQVQAVGRVVGPAAGPQRNVELGYSAAGNRCLAVWDDKRPSAFGQENIRGRFLGLGDDFPICEAAGEQKRPSLAALDDGFMVFWEDRRNSSAPKGPRDIYMTKVTTAGAVQPLGGRQITDDAADESDVEAAGNGKGAFAVWEKSGAEPGLYASRTGPTGVLLDAAPFRVSSGLDSEPDVAADDEGFLVVWESFDRDRRIMGAFVRWASSGAAQVGAEFEVGPFLDGPAEPEVIRTGDCFLVSWNYSGTDNDGATILGRRMCPDGTSPDPWAVTLASEVRANNRAMLDSDGCVYLLTIPAKPENPVLQARRICYTGVIDVGGRWNISQPGIDHPQDPAVIGGAGANAWVAWEDIRNDGLEADEDIYAKPFSKSIYLSPATLISTASGLPQMEGSPVQGGDMVAWMQEGGDMSAGLVLYSRAGGSWWWPATQPPAPVALDRRRRVGAFTTVPTGVGQNAILWRGAGGKLEGARLAYNYFEYSERLALNNPPDGVIGISSVPEFRSTTAGQLADNRPPTAVILSSFPADGSGGVSCAGVVLSDRETRRWCHWGS